MKNKIISLIVTFGGFGNVRHFPGTVGSLAGLFLGVFIIFFFNHNIFLMSFFILTLIGIFATDEYLKSSKNNDPQEVVIDEVLGQWIAIAFVPFTASSLILAFVIFRILDIGKPFPINKIETIKGYIGVIGDDILAGVVTAIIIISLNAYGLI
ncbi:phosphatidylglycerophosphatase A [Hyphomicrobiales bacterium]|nr:phosphatidylglycerophosphatase A [Hyphomicrobiales bacterium]|tara:strand:+ start:896 stop:1354 length:459 start_codon:yes stop_codon:yes gene_type:complete